MLPPWKPEIPGFQWVLNVECFQGCVEQLNLQLQLLKRKICVRVNVRRTVCETITEIVNSRSEGIDIRLQRVNPGN